MFRDLKEYQDIAKIYADKVSKPENLEERRGSSVQQLAQNRANAFKPATPPQGGAGGGVGNPTNVRGSGARNNRPKPQPETQTQPPTQTQTQLHLNKQNQNNLKQLRLNH